MGKISPVASKYIVHAKIDIDGVVDRPDIIGAIFGQTEGLLGADLELRELQRSGRIGRIEVNTDTRGGKSQGMILLPSSLDKAETAIVASALEIIQRIGPCTAKLHVEKIEDVRISKRQFVIERAKELLKTMMDETMPDSQELTEDVINAVRVMEVSEYGKDRLACGPGIDDAEELIVVEGRADVVNLLKHGFKNVIAMNGTNVPETIIELSRRKDIIVFVDGDRGGDLIVKGMLAVAEVDFVAKAPDGMEVEELAKKEIHKALRGKVTAEQIKLEIAGRAARGEDERILQRPLVRATGQEAARPFDRERTPERGPSRPVFGRNPTMGRAPPPRRARVSDEEKAKFKTMMEELVGTHGAFLLDAKLNILGKVPSTELAPTIKSLNSGIYAIIFDGGVDAELVQTADRAGVQYVVGMANNTAGMPSRCAVLAMEEL